MARKTFTPEFRATIVARVKAGETMYAIGKAEGIAASTITKWVKADAEGTTLMTDAEKSAAGRAAQKAKADARAEDLVFLLTRGGEHHADNLARRTGLAASSLESVLTRVERRDLLPLIVFGDGRPAAAEEREDGEYFSRYALNAADYRDAA